MVDLRLGSDPLIEAKCRRSGTPISAMSTTSWLQFGLTSEFDRRFRTPIGHGSCGCGSILRNHARTPIDMDGFDQSDAICQFDRALISTVERVSPKRKIRQDVLRAFD